MLQRTQLGELDEKTKADLCASFQRRAIDQLLTRARRACQWGKERLGSDIDSIVRHLSFLSASSHNTQYVGLTLR